MIDISFAKLLVVIVVGLIVVGPDRLPKLAHFLGRCIGKMRALTQSITNEFSPDTSTPTKKLQKLEQDSNKNG